MCVCVLKEFASQVKSKQKLLLRSTASILCDCCFCLAVVEEISWSVAGFPAKTGVWQECNRVERSLLYHAIWLIPDWWVVEVESRYELVRRGGKKQELEQALLLES